MIELDRYIIVRRGCPFCLMAIKAVLFVNRYLPYEKRIQIFDNFQWEELKFLSHPFIEERVDQETFDGYPYIYIDGGVIEPAPTECLIICIAKKVSHDLLAEINYGGRVISPEPNMD